MELVRLSTRETRELASEWVAHLSILALRDPRLVVLPELSEYLEVQLLRSVEEGRLALASRDHAGWRALAQGVVCTLRPDDPAQEIVYRTSILWNVVWLRPADSCQLPELFAAIDSCARKLAVEANYVCFHACDTETGGLVARHGFDPAYAHCVRLWPVREHPAPPEGVRICTAELKDAARIVDCHLEELEYHAECAPSQRTSYPGRRERQLQGCEDVIRDPNGISLYAEYRGEVIGVADGRLAYSSPRPSMMVPEETIGFIRSVGTRAAWRTRGVGTALSLALAAAFQRQGARRFELVYCPWNPLSSRFWQHLGWLPVSFGFVKKTP